MSTPRVRANLRVAGPDGTALATDVYLPADADRVPAVVTRTAYDRSVHLGEGLGWAARGFAFVVQDVRGRYDSDGTWTPYRNERGDGAALLDWIAAQPWSDGRAIAVGGSYSGHTAWAMAVARPALVRGVISLGAALGLPQVKYDPSGVLRLAEHAAWWTERAEARTSRTGLTAAMFTAHPDLLHHLPVTGLPQRLWAQLEHWTEVIDAGGDHVDDEAITDTDLADLPVASLHVGGWYDLLAAETIRHWQVTGAKRTPRPPRSLLIGPWEHDLAWARSTTVGCRDHGQASRIDPGALQLDWIRQVLDGTPAPHDNSPAPLDGARVFVVGGNRWWHGAQWPPPDTRETTLHAQPGGGLAAAPARSGADVDHYRYDPRDPYPSADPGADRSACTGRGDARRYTTAPLPAPVTIAGAATVRLHATSTATATDFVVRLNECAADGRIVAVAQGVVDTGRAGPPPYDIQLEDVAVTVPTGSRLQLEITSSDFPYLARNLNTGTDRYRTAATAVADQAVHVGRTSVTLPILGEPWTST